jgi:glycosyltransferase involved in cell wall biosynthesis
VTTRLPIVTIGVCVRNRETLVGDALLSIAEQDFPHELMEIIVVDDGSTDSTLSVVDAQNRKLKLEAKIIHQEWKGLGYARNVVLNNSTAKYIIWVDSDMVLAEDFVRLQVGFMEENPNVGVAKGSYGMYRANVVSTLENIEFITTNSKWMRQVDPNALGTGGSIYRVEAIKKVGGFNKNIKGSGEDAEAEFRMGRAGWMLDTTSAVFFERRRSDWRSIWKEYFWHGKGSLQVVKGQSSTSRYKFFPPVAFTVECIRIVVAYKIVRRKVALLLPFHYVFKRTAWLAGLLHARFIDKIKLGKDVS